MKVNLTQPIKNYDGKLIKDEKDKLTLKKVLVVALNSQDKNEVITPEQKSKIYQLSLKMYESKEPNFTVDDLSFIKERVGKFWSALVYGRVCDLIDNKEK